MSNKDKSVKKPQVVTSKLGLVERWSRQFRSRFQKLETALVVSRAIVGISVNLSRRATAIDKYTHLLRKTIDSGGDTATLHRYLTRVQMEVHQLRTLLKDTTELSQGLKAHLNPDVDLEKHWCDSKKESLDPNNPKSVSEGTDG